MLPVIFRWGREGVEGGLVVVVVVGDGVLGGQINDVAEIKSSVYKESGAEISVTVVCSFHRIF